MSILLISFLFLQTMAYRKGMTFTNGKYCPNVTFDTMEAHYSLKQLRSTGADYIALVVTWYQHNVSSTEIFPLYEKQEAHHYTYLTESDAQIESIIKYAHSIGLKVMMKMHIDLISDDQHWRGDIGITLRGHEWVQWFNSYQTALFHYARLSEALNVEAFSVSCELIQVSKQEYLWRKLLKQLRTIFSGEITSSANWGWLNEVGGEDTQKEWWDALDYIGIDAYYNIYDDMVNATLEERVKAWDPVIARFDQLSKLWNKKVVLTEIGYCSGKCSRDYKPTSQDFEEQAKKYEAAFLALKDKEWFDGIFWWSWNSDPRNGGDDDNCITPQNKPAEEIVRSFYGGTERFPKLEGSASCLCTV